jgi:hypothetical protein
MARSNAPVLVIIAALVVVGAGAAGWFLFNKPDPQVVAAEPTALAPATPAKTPTKAPSLDPTTKVSDTPAAEQPKKDRLVRDHRPEGTPPIDLPPVIRPPDARKMKPQTSGMLTKAVKLVMRDCVKSIPAEERTGEKPKMEAVVTVAIKDKTATVTKATIQLRDVTGSATDAAKSCIENNVLHITEGVDEADLESYDVTTSYLF